MPKISIIIPIYKVENYIERCVRSLMEQTMDNLEFIFVNDCTPDNSMIILHQVLQDYPHRKHQVAIINNAQNLGPSDSRKRALNIAKGIYIGCCDSDDWIDKNYYETMYNATNNESIDIIVSDYYLSGKEEKKHCFIASKTPHDSLAMMNNNNYFSYSMCNQIIKCNLIKEQIKHIIPTRLREDTFLMMRVYFHASNIYFIPKAFYHYTQENETSLCHNIDLGKEAWEKQKENITSIAKLLNNKKFQKGVNLFKYMLKQKYRNSFPNLKTYYYTFRESHSDFVYESNKTNPSLKNRLKMKIVWDTFYFFFWLHHYKNYCTKNCLK